MAREQLLSCIDACNACAVACDHCATTSLSDTDVTPMARCIQLNVDCAEICRLTAALLARGSELSVGACAMCAEACQACGEECIRQPADHCKECAAVCQRCFDACRRMLGERTGAARRRGHDAGLSAH